MLVDDHKGERNRRELRRTVEDFREILARFVKLSFHLVRYFLTPPCSLRNDSRAALLASKRAIDSQSHSLREELLSSSPFKEKSNTSEKVSSVFQLLDHISFRC